MVVKFFFFFFNSLKKEKKMDILAPDTLLGENQRVFKIRDNFINCVNYMGECTVWETVDQLCDC